MNVTTKIAQHSTGIWCRAIPPLSWAGLGLVSAHTQQDLTFASVLLSEQSTKAYARQLVTLVLECTTCQRSYLGSYANHSSIRPIHFLLYKQTIYWFSTILIHSTMIPAQCQLLFQQQQKSSDNKGSISRTISQWVGVMVVGINIACLEFVYHIGFRVCNFTINAARRLLLQLQCLIRVLVAPISWWWQLPGPG